MPKSTLGLVALAIAGIFQISPAVADETGFHAIHDLRREGNKLCMSDHWHYGAGERKPNRKAAERDAAAAWSGFTAFEYGTTWANFALAAGKSFDCNPDGNGVVCGVNARPCRALPSRR